MLIDDNPEYLREWRKARGNTNKPCLLMTANHNKNKEHNDLIRVNNWKEIDRVMNLILMVVI